MIDNMGMLTKFIIFLSEQKERKENAEALIYSVKLQKHFGLTLRESLAIKRNTIKKALENGVLRLTHKDATPNAKIREIPISTSEQRQTLGDVLQFMESKHYHSLIPPFYKLKEQYNYAERIRRKFEQIYGVKFNYLDLYNSFKERKLTSEKNVVKFPLSVWKVKFPDDFIWQVEDSLAVRKPMSSPPVKMGDLKEKFLNLMIPNYLEAALRYYCFTDNKSEIVSLFKSFPVTVLPLNLGKMAKRKGFQYIVYNGSLEVNVLSIYWVVDKKGVFHRVAFDYLKLADYILPQGKRHLLRKGFLGIQRIPENGNLGSLVTKVGSQNIIGVIKMTSIDVEGEIACKTCPPLPDEFLFLSFTAYL